VGVESNHSALAREEPCDWKHKFQIMKINSRTLATVVSLIFLGLAIHAFVGGGHPVFAALWALLALVFVCVAFKGQGQAG
jgi:hypothetical protein